MRKYAFEAALLLAVSLLTAGLLSLSEPASAQMSNPYNPRNVNITGGTIGGTTAVNTSGTISTSSSVTANTSVTAGIGSNSVRLGGAPNGSDPAITALGVTDANVSLAFAPKGTGTLKFNGPSATTGAATFGGNVTVAGTLGSAANTSLPGPANSGVSLGAANEWALVSLYDQANTANNRTTDMLFNTQAFKIRFVNDARNAVVDALTINGGQALGVTSIASTSGSGAWTHTGAFTVTGVGSISGNLGVGGKMQASGGVQLQTFLTAAIPGCSAGNTGLTIAVLDVGGTPAWNATLPAGTGTPAAATTFPVFCDGTEWKIK